MNRSSRQLPSGPTVALVGPLAGENVSNSAAQARLAHLWSAAKLIAPTHAQLAQSYVRQAVRLAGNTPLPKEMMDGICANCYVPLLPGQTCSVGPVLSRAKPRKISQAAVAGPSAPAKLSKADEQYACTVCKYIGTVAINWRARKKRKPVEKPVAQVSVPAVAPPPPVPAPVLPPPASAGPISLFNMKSLLATPSQAQKPSLLSAAVAPPRPPQPAAGTARSAASKPPNPKAQAANAANPKGPIGSQKRPAPPASSAQRKPKAKFTDLVQNELDKQGSGASAMKFFM